MLVISAEDITAHKIHSPPLPNVSVTTKNVGTRSSPVKLSRLLIYVIELRNWSGKRNVAKHVIKM